MKICPKCGNELFDDAVICTKCGSAQEKSKPQPTKDRMNIFWFIISFLVWWVGILLFIYLGCTLWHVELPRSKIALVPPVVEVQSLNHWTARKSKAMTFF